MKKEIGIEMKIVHHPIEGPSISFTFSRKIKYFGLNVEKATLFASGVFELIQKIEAERNGHSG